MILKLSGLLIAAMTVNDVPVEHLAQNDSQATEFWNDPRLAGEDDQADEPEVFDPPEIDPVEPDPIVEEPEIPATGAWHGQEDSAIAGRVAQLESRMDGFDRTMNTMASGINELVQNSKKLSMASPSLTIEDVEKVVRASEERIKEHTTTTMRSVMIEYRDADGSVQSTAVPIDENGSARVTLPDTAKEIVTIDSEPVIIEEPSYPYVESIIEESLSPVMPSSSEIPAYDQYGQPLNESARQMGPLEGYAPQSSTIIQPEVQQYVDPQPYIQPIIQPEIPYAPATTFQNDSFSATMYPGSDGTGLILQSQPQCYTDPVTGQTTCPGTVNQYTEPVQQYTEPSRQGLGSRLFRGRLFNR